MLDFQKQIDALKSTQQQAEKDKVAAKEQAT